MHVEDSDVDDLDFNNFKGIYYGDKHDKYQDPETGCHFLYSDLCNRLRKLKEKRKVLDLQLGLKSPTRSTKKTSPPDEVSHQKSAYDKNGNVQRLETEAKLQRNQFNIL